MLPGRQVGRFDLSRRIGEGAFGVVFEAHASDQLTPVALKLLRRNRSDALYGFKQEFRALADVFHPNLVRLFELSSDGDDWFFTMELVDGVSFHEHVCLVGGGNGLARAVATDDLSALTELRATSNRFRPHAGRLREAMVQLSEGLTALHDHGKVHRDVKPSNVLVAKDGRVVLLDFGLVADIRDPHGDRKRTGTPGYMSPEQSAGQPLGPASDWFSVGAMLHEALCGEPARPGSRALDAVTPELSDLAQLCADLLRPRPGDRATGKDIVSRLKSRSGAPLQPMQPDLMFGREGQLEQLMRALGRALDGRTQLVRVVGRSGIGKTKLVQSFLGSVGAVAPGARVFPGRCYEHETVPYKALDSLVDALGRHVLTLDRETLESVLPIGRHLLGRLFRIFQDLPAAPEAVAPPAALESQEQRSLAFNALRELVHGLARRQPLVLFVDDVQWGDADSARLLCEIIRAPCTGPLLILVSYREDAAGEFLDFLDEAELGIEQERLTLSQLSVAAARSLARHLLPEQTAEVVDAVATEAGGSPIFIQQLAHQAISQASATSAASTTSATNVDAVVRERVALLPEDAQRLLLVVAVAGQPVPDSIAARAALLDETSARAAAFIATSAKLLAMRSSKSGVQLEFTHDRLRDAIGALTSSEQATEIHLRLATAFLEHVQPDVDALTRHFAAAGEVERTRQYSALAAERAELAFAFDRAAQHLAILARFTPEQEASRWELLKRWGDALANAGQSGKASDVLEAAAAALSAQDPKHVEALSLSRRSGELALRSGRFDVGLQRMRLALRRVGVSMPRSRASSLGLAVVRRLRFLVRGHACTPRAAADVSPATRARLDALWGASTGLSMTNHVLADALGVSHLLEALDGGSHSHAIRALGYEAAFEAVIGGPFFGARCQRILETMERLSNESDQPYDRAWARMSKGVTVWFLGDWATALRCCNEAAAAYREHCRGVAWELAICDAYRLPSLTYLGDLTKLAQVVPRALNGSYERGDLFAAATLRLGQQSVVLLRDDTPDHAMAEASQAIAAFPTETYLLPHYHYLFAMVQAELYAGRGRAAFERTSADWRGLKQSRLLNAQCMRVEIRHLLARAALAHSIDAEAPSRAKSRTSAQRLRRLAGTLAQKIAPDQVKHAPPFAAAIRASVSRLEGRDEDARRLLSEALHGFEAAGMQLYAQATRDRLGALEGGEGGAVLRQQAQAWMTSQQVKNPAAMIAMLLPGA